MIDGWPPALTFGMSALKRVNYRFHCAINWTLLEKSASRRNFCVVTCTYTCTSVLLMSCGAREVWGNVVHLKGTWSLFNCQSCLISYFVVLQTAGRQNAITAGKPGMSVVTTAPGCKPVCDFILYSCRSRWKASWFIAKIIQCNRKLAKPRWILNLLCLSSTNAVSKVNVCV